VTIPSAEVKRLNLAARQLVGVELEPASDEVGLEPDLRNAVEDRWNSDEAAYRYLADR
jgi:hypothetical protein